MTEEAPSVLHLLDFVPFRLNRLAAQVSEHLAEVYRERFGLEIADWRVLVTVAPERGCTAQHIADSTRMHKSRVSRAIARLVDRGLIERAARDDDRREMELRLTSAGRRLYAKLVPLALERERQLLSCMSDTEQRSFATALDRLEAYLNLARPNRP